MVKDKLAIFDLDNTLIDSAAKLRADVIGAMHRLGVEIASDQIGKNWYEMAANYGFSKEEFDEAFDQRDTWEQSLEAGVVSIFPETIASLNQLRNAGIPLGLLSKSIPQYTEAKLKHFGLGKYFDYTETVHPKEPSKEIGANNLMKHFGVNGRKNQVYFIGDRSEDVAVATTTRRNFRCNARGIYINREGIRIPYYTNAKNLHEVNDYILSDGS